MCEENTALEAMAFRAQRFTNFFESHANTTFEYADDYIKAVHRIYLCDGTLESVWQSMAAVPPARQFCHISR